MAQRAARRRREATAAALEPPAAPAGPLPGDAASAGGQDDTLTLLFLCCHPALAPASQVALTLRAVGGLTTAEIARAFLVPEATMAQRISRAKQRIKASGTGFRLPLAAGALGRLPVVLQVLYLIFNEGYTASSGPGLHRAELTVEAIRLTRAVHALLPHDGEVTGLLALMLLTDARRAARTRPDGAPVPLAEQDRSRWDAEAISEGVALVSRGAGQRPARPVSGSGGDRRDPRRGRRAAGHRLARRSSPSTGCWSGWLPAPWSRSTGPWPWPWCRARAPGSRLLSTLDGDGRIAGGHRAEAVRAHLLELAGDRGEARAAFTRAARRTTSLPEQRYLQAQAARLTPRDR